MTFYFQQIINDYFFPWWVAVEAADAAEAHDKLAAKTEGIVVETNWSPTIVNKDGRHGWRWIPNSVGEEQPPEYEISWSDVGPPRTVDFAGLRTGGDGLHREGLAD